MAFVFQTQRWKQPQPSNLLGPGHYNAQTLSKRPKHALITPQTTSKQKLPSKTYSSDYIDEQNLRIIQQNEKNQTIKNSSSKKHFKRAATAKYTLVRKFSFQSPAIFKPKDMNLEVTNSSNAYKKEFENSLINTSLRLQKRYIHSEMQAFGNKPFCDKSLRTMQTNNETSNPKQSDIKYFNTMFTRSISNPNLAKFTQTRKKSQNIFFSSQPSFLKEKQPQNFIIASENCKRQTIKPSKVASMKDSGIMNKLDGNEDMQTTGIEDSLDSSFQYISESTPGPGEYNLRKEIPYLKSKVEKFGVTQMRFKQPNYQEKILNLNIKIPSFKKSSMASQSKVSFGKSRPQTAKQTNSDLIFYDDNLNMENQCIQNLIKDRQAHGAFMSKCDRFRKNDKNLYNGPDFFDKQKNEKITLPNSIFMSKVERQQRPLSPTANIQFEGQDYKTIEQKVQRFKESKQIIDGQIPGFYISETRFKYKSRQSGDEQFQRPLTTGSKKRTQLKSFTFRKQGLVNHQESIQNPAPWSYNIQKKWLKPSHHIRYKF